MANNKKTKFNKNAEGSKDKAKKFELPPIAIVSNIVFSKREAWAYYKISATPFDFLSAQAKVSTIKAWMTSLSSLCQNEGKKVDCHILVANEPLDVDSWEEQVTENFVRWKKDISGTYATFIEGQVDSLREGDFKKRVTYLGVKLFSRGSFSMDNFNVFEFGFKEAIESTKKAISAVFQVPSERITEQEEKRARETEDGIYRILSTGAARAIKPTSEELLLTIKRMFYPFMPSPYLETDYHNRVGLNDIVLETGGYIQNGLRYLKFDQQIKSDRYTGYRATMSFSRFPTQNMGQPYGNPPFLYMPTQRGMPYIINARFTLIPSVDVKKDLEKKKMETDDELKNLANSGQGGHAGIQTTLEDLSDLDRELNDSRDPWVSGSYRITIEMPTQDLLFAAVAELKQEYSVYDTVLTLTTGDQLKLFQEEFPGGTLQVKSFNQMTNLAMIGVAGTNFGGVIGDPIRQQTVTREKR